MEAASARLGGGSAPHHDHERTTVATSVPLSLLDLARVRPSETAAEGVARSVRLARTADDLGYHRLWVSEHHNMPGLASSATSLYIQHLAANTTNLRVGSGGIMLPNHSPLVIAEQFGLLETLFPGRIDLGLGRAPGTDGATMQALRRGAAASEHFPADIVELHGYLTGETTVPGVQAYPHHPRGVPLYILGSSLYGAQLAAHLGLPYAFASHFAPEALVEAATIYRDRFDASRSLAGPDATPHFIAAANVVAADDAETATAQYRRTELEWLRSILGRGQDLSDEQLVELREHPAGRQVLGMLRRTLVGTGPEVVAGLDALAEEVRADELIARQRRGRRGPAAPHPRAPRPARGPTRPRRVPARGFGSGLARDLTTPPVGASLMACRSNHSCAGASARSREPLPPSAGSARRRSARCSPPAARRQRGQSGADGVEQYVVHRGHPVQLQDVLRGLDRDREARREHQDPRYRRQRREPQRGEEPQCREQQQVADDLPRRLREQVPQRYQAHATGDLTGPASRQQGHPYPRHRPVDEADLGQRCAPGPRRPGAGGGPVARQSPRRECGQR